MHIFKKDMFLSSLWVDKFRYFQCQYMHDVKMVAGVDMRFICGLDSQMQFLGVFQTAKFATQKSLKYEQKAFSQTVVNSLETQSNVFRQLLVLSVQP